MSLLPSGPEALERLDWQILRDGGVVLYHREDYLGEDIRWLSTEGYDIYQFQGQRWDSDDEMYSDLSRVLRFSEWWGRDWGRNLDALADCLTDLPISCTGAVLVFHRFDGYANGSGSAFVANGRTKAWALLDVLVRTSRFFLVSGKRFLILVQTDDREMKLEPLAPVWPAWNRREWSRRPVSS